MSATTKSATKKLTDSTRVVEKGKVTKKVTKGKTASNKKARKSKIVDKGKQVAKGIPLFNKENRVKTYAGVENVKIADLTQKQVEKFEKTPIPLKPLLVQTEHSVAHPLQTYCVYQIVQQLFDKGVTEINATLLYDEVSKLIGRDVVNVIKGHSGGFADNPVNYGKCGISNRETCQTSKGIEKWAMGIRGLVNVSGSFGLKANGFLFPNANIDYSNPSKHKDKFPPKITRAQLKPLFIALINRKYGE